jgi:hypothetical protein
MRILIISALVGVSLATPTVGIAQEVAWVYSDTWVAEHEGLEHGDALARDVVETQFYFDTLTVWGSFTAPSGAQVGYGYGTGYGSVAIDISMCSEEETEDGEYGHHVEFHIWGDTQYQGGWELPKLGAARFAYRLSFIWPGNFVARYVRCNPGSQCTAMDVLKSKIRPESDHFPTYIYMRLIWTRPDVCFGSNPVRTNTCVADS